MIGGIENVSSYEAQQSASSIPDASSELGQDAFLKLLVAQMKHQDPLNPQANEEFIAQLAQFTSLEQLMGVNSSLNDLYAATTSMNNASMTQLLGRDVTAFSNVVPYGGDGPQEIYWNSPAECDRMSVTITDADGKMVARQEFDQMDSGEGSWTWDGTDVHGVQVPEGQYNVTITAFDGNGQPLEVRSMIKGMVNEMSYKTGSPVPYVDGVEITIGEILRVEVPDEEGGSSS